MKRRSMGALLSSVVACFCLWSTQGIALTLDQLQAAMDQKGESGWTARETRDFQNDRALTSAFRAGVAEESPPLREVLRSAQDDGEVLRSAQDDGEVLRSAQDDGLPEVLDWRDVDGQDFMPAVDLAQGECGSCVAFAAMSTLEGTLNITCNTPDQPFTLSRQHFFSCGGGRCRGGWRMSQAMSYLEQNGVPDRSCFPYMSADGSDAPCSLTCSDAGQRLVKDISIVQPTRGFIDVQAIKRALLEGPVLANMILYEDLEFYDGGVYRHVAGNKIGSHAVALIGWDDRDQAWIARNSWGPTWGDGGYFKVAFDDPAVLVGRYTWRMDTSRAKASGICQLPR